MILEILILRGGNKEEKPVLDLEEKGCTRDRHGMLEKTMLGKREGESEREKESYNPLDEVARREFYRLCTRSQKYLPGDPISRFVPFLVVPETICLG